MPEVVASKNPEATLIKFAKKNNLYSAQLEKLGHAFNQCKTLVGLQKQANRGDSFSIIDVPSMVEKYATYDPKDVLTAKQKKVHEKVDAITKSASVSTKEVRVPRRDYFQEALSKGAELYQENAEYELTPSSNAFDVTFNKKASEEEKELSFYEKLEMLKEAHESCKEAIAKAGEVMQGARYDIELVSKDIANYIRKEANYWPEIVRDAAYKFGTKCAQAIDTIETYFDINHIPFKTVDLSKSACVHTLIYDKHNMLDTISSVIDSVDTYNAAQEYKEEMSKQASELHETISNLIKESANQPAGNRPNNFPPTSSGGSDSSLFDIPSTSDGIAKALGLVTPLKDAPNTIINDFNKTKGTVSSIIDLGAESKKDRAKKKKEEEDRFSSELALQKLLLSDPVLSEADPTEVQELFKTIATISPTFASNDRMMATALKEAIQYGAVPVSMLKDIADFEDKYTKAKSLRSQLMI